MYHKIQITIIKTIKCRFCSSHKRICDAIHIPVRPQCNAIQIQQKAFKIITYSYIREDHNLSSTLGNCAHQFMQIVVKHELELIAILLFS